jgi:hypothetical protein
MQRFERKFKMWEYWISHSQLVLRSTGGVQFPPGSPRSRNIDLTFVAVDYVELPTTIDELEFVDASADECQRVEKILGREVAHDHIFVIATNGRRHLIVAGNMTVSENDLALNQTCVQRF